MKKLFTLTAGLLMAAMLFAAAPTVVLYNNSNNYEVTIDGRNYSNGNSGQVRITDLNNGRHTVRVYERGTGIFRKRKLVSTQTFDMYNNNVRINVDRNGQLDIRNSNTRQNDRRYEDRNDRRWEDRDDRRWEDDRHDNRDRGRGNKYGHNKDWKKHKKNKDWKD